MNKIEIGQIIQVLIGDEVLEAECVSVHMNECSTVKETCYMLRSAETNDQETVRFSITVVERKGEDSRLDTRA